MADATPDRPTEPRFAPGHESEGRPAALIAWGLYILSLPSANLLVIVDGPPATTGPQARYPAIEWLLTALPDCSAEVILDDYARPDEKAIVQRWCSLLEQRGYRVGLQEHALEKGACSVSFTRLGGSTG